MSGVFEENGKFTKWEDYIQWDLVGILDYIAALNWKDTLVHVSMKCLQKIARKTCILNRRNL